MSSPTTARIATIALFGGENRCAEVSNMERKGPTTETDESLIARLHANEQDALSTLFGRYAKLSYSIGRRILKNATEADDIVQEVFLYIYRKSGLFVSAKGSARSWIVQVTYTQAFLRRRHLKARGFYASGGTDKSVETELHTSSDAEYDQTVEGLFGRNGWKKALEALTAEQRETLRLHFFEGCTFVEIAQKMGQSYANVRHHHYRGLEKLRKHFSENGLNGQQSA